MADGQQQWRGKGGDQLLEVAASKRLLAVGPEANHAAILGEDPPPEHMSDDLALGHLIHPRENVVEPPSPVAVRNATFLERQRHHLLRKDVSRSDPLHETVSPKAPDAMGHHQRLVACS
jgi:hypothetical protein